MMLLAADLVVCLWGMDFCLCSGGCSWVGMHNTAHWAMLWGWVQSAVARASWLLRISLCVGWRRLPRCGVPSGLLSPLELVFPPLERVLPPLEGALFVVLLGLRKPWCNWPWPLLPHFLPLLFWWIACWLFAMLQQFCCLWVCFLGAQLLFAKLLQPCGIPVRWLGLWCIGVWRIQCQWSVLPVFLWSTSGNTGDVLLTCRG